MLKWAVNQPRPSYLDANPSKANVFPCPSISPFPSPTTSPTPTPTVTPLTQRVKLKRHSLLPSHCQLGKENQLTSTPLPSVAISATRTPLLRDLSNIMSPLQMTTPTVSKPTVYASTLPTFEAEYSPSYSYRTNENNNNNNIIPGPMLALRGMGIPDSYFEKPRYLEQKQLPLPPSHAPTADAPTLSSSQMGDVTLERMIDAILESTRKAPAPAPGAGGGGGGGGRTRSRAAPRQRLRQRPHQRIISTSATHSPTYRPAFDPASDLCEYWQSSPAPAAAASAASVASTADGYEEREVRSPQSGSGSGVGGLGLGLSLGQGQGKRRSLQLRRQRVVRRKRKITTKISSSVRQSAQKLLAAASRSAQKLPSRSNSCSRSRFKQRHISPDSGHNSTSDCEMEEEEEEKLGIRLGDEQLEASCNLDAIWMHTEARDATKRRLSFSLSDDS